MKLFTFISMAIVIFTSCDTSRPLANDYSPGYNSRDTLITQSLFNDRNSTISEADIQRILDGSYKLPQQLRVAMVRLENPQQRRNRWGWNDEDYLKTQQSYLDLFTQKFKQSPRVTNVSVIPDLLVSKSPGYTSLREAAVRMQADVVVVYSITSDLYSKYKLFSKADIKAFATTQLIVIDVRTGLVPFSAIATKDYLSQKTKDELGEAEARTRVQHEAVLLTIDAIGQRIAGFLNK